MNKLIFLAVSIFFLLLTSDLYSQDVFKFRAKYVSFTTYQEYSGWSEWTDWDEANILIVLDFRDSRITVYANNTNYLDYYDSEIKEYGDKNIMYFSAVDQDGTRCRVRFVYYVDEDYRELYIDYSDLVVAYAVKPMNQFRD